MALHFVSTSVLSSEDGIGFDKEMKKDTDEVRKMKLEAELLQSKPLFEQLADQNMKKQAEYDAMTKLIFAPPKALDEDDIEYYNDLEQRKNNAQRLRSDFEEKALEEFRLSAKEIRSETHMPVIFSNQNQSEKIVAEVKPLLVVKAKRKAKSNNNSIDPNKKSKLSDSQDIKSSLQVVDKIISKSEKASNEINYGNSAPLTNKMSGVHSLGLENYDSEEED